MLIPHEHKLMLVPHSTFCSQGWPMLIPNEDKLMLFLIQHIVQRGWRMLISSEDKLALVPHSTSCLEGLADFDCSS